MEHRDYTKVQFINYSDTWQSRISQGNVGSGTQMTERDLEIMNMSKNWLRTFANDIGAERYYFHPGHYVWTAFVLLDGQWWYLNSGDFRLGNLTGLLVRKAKSLIEYRGDVNRSVEYSSDTFDDDVRKIMGVK